MSESKRNATSEFAIAGDFFSSIVAGLLLGLAGDHFLGTEPWLVVTGVVAGSVSGFYAMFRHSQRLVQRGD